VAVWLACALQPGLMCESAISHEEVGNLMSGKITVITLVGCKKIAFARRTLFATRNHIKSVSIGIISISLIFICVTLRQSIVICGQNYLFLTADTGR